MLKNFKFINIFLLISILLLLVGCSSKSEIIKIGFSYELTGPNSELGRDAMYGALLAVNKINESGGINGKTIELVIKDDKGDPDVAVEVDNALIEEGCVAIIGHGTSNLAQKTIDNANDKNFLMISPTISTSDYEDIDDNFFRIIPSNSIQGSSLGDFILGHTPGDVMIFKENINSAYTDTVATSLIDRLEETQFPVNSNNIHSFETKNLDSYHEVVNTINEGTATNIVILGSSFDVSRILQNDLRDDIKVYFAVWGSTLDIFSSSGDSVNYTHGINYFNSNSINPKLIEFLDSYKSNYGFDASFSSMLSYETVYTLVEAIKNSDSMETEDIKASLLNLDKVNWLDDDITINDTGDSIRKLYWYHLLNNSFVEVE